MCFFFLISWSRRGPCLLTSNPISLPPITQEPCVCECDLSDWPPFRMFDQTTAAEGSTFEAEKREKRRKMRRGRGKRGKTVHAMTRQMNFRQSINCCCDKIEKKSPFLPFLPSHSFPPTPAPHTHIHVRLTWLLFKHAAMHAFTVPSSVADGDGSALMSPAKLMLRPSDSETCFTSHISFMLISRLSQLRKRILCLSTGDQIT